MQDKCQGVTFQKPLGLGANAIVNTRTGRMMDMEQWQMDMGKG